MTTRTAPTADPAARRLTKNVPLTDATVMRRIPKDLRAVVRTASEMGWTGTTSGNGGLRLYSPDGVTIVTIPASIGDNHTVSNVSRQILRATPATAQRDFAERVADRISDTHTETSPVPQAASAVEQVSQVASDEPVVTPPTVVFDGPWMVNRAGHKAPSALVIEKVWSDGRVEYVCSICGQGLPTPQRVTRHAMRHNRPDWGKAAVVQDNPLAPQPDPSVPNDEPPLVVPEPEPEAEPATDPEDPSVVLSNEKIVSEIRHLLLGREIVDRKRLMEAKDARISALEEHQATLMSQIEELTGQAAAWKAKAIRAQETLSAFAGLAQEAMQETEG